MALAACVLALLLGVAMVDDYGVWGDAYQQLAIGEANLRHLAGERGLNLLWPPTDRLYGPVFEVFLRLVDRVLDHDDSRSAFLSRYLLTHLFFLIGCFAGYLLACRLFGSRWLALFTLLLLLLHPRIYAHSFFNSKDLPFFSLFMICLWLAHRAFGNGTGQTGAFALCGVTAGLLTNLRILGLVFVAVVVFMRVCDIGAAKSGDERRRAIAGCATFALVSVATFYATMPYLWADPVVRFMEIVTVMSAHPTDKPQLFQGVWLLGSALPRSYLPVWFGITTPPLALLLGAVGFGAVVWRAAAALFPSAGAPRDLLRNTPLRFELLVVACFILPLLAAVVLRPTLYNGWRHFYFLWGPFVLLAASGLRVLIDGVRGARRHRRPRRLPTFVGGLAALGLTAIAVETARLHPHQHLYFNVLADRPGAALPLRQRYSMADRFSAKHGYAHILEELADHEESPNAVFNVQRPAAERRARELPRLGIAKPRIDLELFRQQDQQRFKFNPNADPDFFVKGHERHILDAVLFPPALYERKVYGRAIVQVATPDLSRVDEAMGAAYRAIYRQVTSGAPALRGDVDVYRDEAAITWVKETCAPGDLHDTMDMTVIPLDAMHGRRAHRALGVRLGDACLWQAPLPDQPIAKILIHGIGALASDAHLEERRRRYAKLAATPPAARSTFDVYLADGTLFYVKAPCLPADIEAPFFTHVRPVRLGDIPRSRHRHRQHGFEALDFRFGGFDRQWQYAASDIFDDVCLATLDLPDYPIASIASGQYAPGGDVLWRVDIGGG